MEIINPKDFALVCYLQLMAFGGELIDKSPNYIEEKSDMLNQGYDAFSRLDYYNMRSVIDWAKTWNVALPEEVTERFNSEQTAMISLRERGIII